MPSEWYLITPPKTLSGFENEQFENYSPSQFDELLTTDFADTIVLYDKEGVEISELRAIVLGNVTDVESQAAERKLLAPIGNLEAGYYVKYRGRMWLIYTLPDNNLFYEKAMMCLCQWQLKWQDSDGNIYSRWINVESASKYSKGYNTNKVVKTPDEQSAIRISKDEYSELLDDKRIFIDNKTYLVTRMELTEYDYSDGGVLYLIASRCQIDEDTDNTDEGICDYISEPVERYLRIGAPAQEFTSVSSSFDLQLLDIQEGYVHMVVSGTTAEISVDYAPQLVGTSFTLNGETINIIGVM